MNTNPPSASSSVAPAGTSLQTTAPAYSAVPTRRGDTLQKIALREMGDATQWYQLVYLNNLSYPFITDDAALAGHGVLLTGSTILVPVSSAPQPITNPDVIYGQDVALSDGFLSTNNGDMAIAAGLPNLEQALVNRVNTDAGELVFHPDYGCSVKQVLGTKGTSRLLAAAAFVKRALLQDTRITSVPSATVTLSGGVMGVAATAETVTSVPVGVTI